MVHFFKFSFPIFLLQSSLQPVFLECYMIHFHTIDPKATIFVYRSRVMRDYWTLFDLCIVFMAWLDMVVSAVVTTVSKLSKWMFPKIMVSPIIHFNRVFHEINHPFWGSLIFGNPSNVTRQTVRFVCFSPPVATATSFKLV